MQEELEVEKRRGEQKAYGEILEFCPLLIVFAVNLNSKK